MKNYIKPYIKGIYIEVSKMVYIKFNDKIRTPAKSDRIVTANPGPAQPQIKYLQCNKVD